MNREVALPRWHEVSLARVLSSPTDARVSRVLIANLPEGYRRAVVQVELSFNASAAPVNGDVRVVPIRHTENLGQGRDFRRSAAVQAVGAGPVAASFTAGEPAFGSCVLDGFDAVEVSNTLDVDLLNVRVGFKVISQPTVETGR